MIRFHQLGRDWVTHDTAYSIYSLQGPHGDGVKRVFEGIDILLPYFNYHEVAVKPLPTFGAYPLEILHQYKADLLCLAHISHDLEEE